MKHYNLQKKKKINGSFSYQVSEKRRFFFSSEQLKMIDVVTETSLYIYVPLSVSSTISWTVSKFKDSKGRSRRRKFYISWVGLVCVVYLIKVLNGGNLEKSLRVTQLIRLSVTVLEFDDNQSKHCSRGENIQSPPPPK